MMLVVTSARVPQTEFLSTFTVNKIPASAENS